MKRRSKRKNESQELISANKLKQKYGLTDKMITRFFPDPDFIGDLSGKKKNMQKLYWSSDTVDKTLADPSLQSAIAHRQEQIKRSYEEKNKLAVYLNSFSLDNYIIEGKKNKRNFVLHVGPTNSGKTYDAIQKMTECKSGTYLGPLRLLALEMFEKLNGLGCPCNLLTGEEAEIVDGARFVASTIELCNFHRQYDIAVIDEAQLIADPYRGSNWTQAICLVQAAEVHICLAPEAELIIIELLDQMEQQYRIIRHERLAPLQYGGFCTGLNEVEKGDCIIAFSRKNVLNIAANLERMGMKASVIYGALPPHSRRNEVRKFTDGETSVVVATDAIGMGVSLPIRRIIFSTITKYDGKARRLLTFSEIKQIAGRAGRYGMYEEGYVLTMDEPAYVKKAINSTCSRIRSLFIAFPEESFFTEFDLGEMLETWRKLPTNRLFKRENMEEAEYLLGMLPAEKSRRDKQLTYNLITCPVDVKNDELVRYWNVCANAILNGHTIPEPWFECMDLEGCELQYRAYDVYHQLLRRLDLEDNSLEQKTRICARIAELMKEKGKYLRRCRVCNALLPIDSPYGICNKCYSKNLIYDFDYRSYDYFE